LVGRLCLARALVLVDRLRRVVGVLGFRVRRRAVALVDVPGVAAATAALAAGDNGRVRVRLLARNRGGRRVRVLIDLVLGLLLLLAPLRLARVIRRAVAAAWIVLVGRLALGRALVLVDPLSRVVVVLGLGVRRR